MNVMDQVAGEREDVADDLSFALTQEVHSVLVRRPNRCGADDVEVEGDFSATLSESAFGALETDPLYIVVL